LTSFLEKIKYNQRNMRIIKCDKCKKIQKSQKPALERKWISGYVQGGNPENWISFDLCDI
jgi:hypothetical protein